MPRKKETSEACRKYKFIKSKQGEYNVRDVEVTGCRGK
jgi:hypothetical protein